MLFQESHNKHRISWSILVPMAIPSTLLVVFVVEFECIFLQYDWDYFEYKIFWEGLFQDCLEIVQPVFSSM